MPKNHPAKMPGKYFEKAMKGIPGTFFENLGCRSHPRHKFFVDGRPRIKVTQFDARQICLGRN